MDSIPSLPPTPAAVKFVNTLLARSKELEQADAVIAYYCKLHAAQQILASNLHKTDASVAEFVGELLDQIEYLKANSPKLTSADGQAILSDDTVAASYVEAFALNVFAKADKDVYEKSTTKATIMKFMAAATFLDLLNVFGGDNNEDGSPKEGLDQDILEKIKYSKWQASRIAKDYKQGTDPNEYTPPAPSQEESQSVDDLLAQTVKDVELETHGDGEEESHGLSAPSVDQDTAKVSNDEELNEDDFFIPPPSAAPLNSSTAIAGPDIAPSTYTPSVPTFSPSSPPLPSTSPVPRAPPASNGFNHAPQNVPVYNVPPPSNSYTNHTPHASEHLSRAQVQSILDESELITKVQKHCKFAISALTYEDMKTAFKEIDAARNLLLRNVPESELY